MTGERTGWPQISVSTVAPTPSAPGSRRGWQNHQGVIRWPCVRRTKKATRSPTSRFGIQADISGIGSSGRKSSSEMQAKGEITMKNKARAIFPVMCSLVMAAVVYAELKKGYYSPAELGALRQAVPIELSPDSNFQVSSYPVPAVDLAPGDGLQDVQIYCNTCHSPRDFYRDVQLGDGSRRLRRIEKRLLLFRGTRSPAPSRAYRAFAGFELPGFVVSRAGGRSRPRRWPARRPDLLQHLPQPALHHHAAAAPRRHLGSRSKQDEQNLRRRHSRRQHAEDHSLPASPLRARHPQTVEWKSARFMNDAATAYAVVAVGGLAQP